MFYLLFFMLLLPNLDYFEPKQGIPFDKDVWGLLKEEVYI